MGGVSSGGSGLLNLQVDLGGPGGFFPFTTQERKFGSHVR